MDKLVQFMIKRRYFILSTFILFALAGLFLSVHVTVNSDMSAYLPADSSAKEGIKIMKDQFPDANTLHVVMCDLHDADKMPVRDALLQMEHVDMVSYDPAEDDCNHMQYTLYTLQMGVDAYSAEAKATVEAICLQYAAYEVMMTGEAIGTAGLEIVSHIFLPAIIILLVILFIMCQSWIEPFIFVLNISIAICINLGTNIIFSSVSDVTQSISAILQLVLSMDYSIILMKRYRQEKEQGCSADTAMKSALHHSFTAISASSVTTIVAMLTLIFMSFTIGRDFGLVIAKGVFISFICVCTVMPSLILLFNKVIDKTPKRAPLFKMNRLASFCFRSRLVILIIFMVVFAGSLLLKDHATINYTTSAYDKVRQIFPLDNPIVIVYENEDEEEMTLLAERWAENEEVTSITSYSLQVKSFAGIKAFSAFSGLNISAGAGIHQLKGEHYSRMILHTRLPDESSATFSFIEVIASDMKEMLTGEYHITGNSAIAYEMHSGFSQELSLITLLSVLSIFIVVAAAFRSLTIPAILVCAIQCAAYITTSPTSIQGLTISYLPLLIVQCLLMGAVIDYGILYTSCYIQSRQCMGIRDSLIAALNHTMQTLMTSGLILIAVTLALGLLLANENAAIAEILLLISRGCLCAMILVVFALPGLICVTDRWVTSSFRFPFSASSKKRRR